jgi:chromosome segregation ATPase
MGQSGSHKATSGRSLNAIGRGTAPLADPRVVDLEAQLELATRALQSQRSSYDEDSASFEKTLSRLAQSERALSQTKARLVDAEALARAEQARTEALAAELAALKANAAAEIALAKESTTAAEAREQQALAAARAARFELAANVAELEELQGKVSDLHAEHALRQSELIAERALCETDLREVMAHNGRLKSELQDCQAEVAAAEERNAVLTHERKRLSGLLGSLEVLSREITHLTAQATTATENLPKVEAWLGRDVAAEHVRATMRPQCTQAPAAKAPRSQSAPEIMVDGVKLES